MQKEPTSRYDILCAIREGEIVKEYEIEVQLTMKRRLTLRIVAAGTEDIREKLAKEIRQLEIMLGQQKDATKIIEYMIEEEKKAGVK